MVYMGTEGRGEVLKALGLQQLPCKKGSTATAE